MQAEPARRKLKAHKYNISHRLPADRRGPGRGEHTRRACTRSATHRQGTDACASGRW